jgi:Glyoxalase-like domain
MIDSITFDASHAATLARFWCEVLPEYQIAPYGADDIAQLKAKGIDDVEDDPNVMCVSEAGGPRLFFQKVPEAKTAKSRVHLDVQLRDRAHLDRLIELGASIVREWDDGGSYWMTDPDGNDFCASLS